MTAQAIPPKKVLFFGLVIQCFIMVISWMSQDSWADIFRYAARYSGRFSFGIYLLCFYWFLKEFKPSHPFIQTQKWTYFFAVMHLIHFGFLALSVYLNSLPIVLVKLTGGFLAYLAIIFYPFFIGKIKWKAVHFVYFYYVGFVMAVTFLARIRGDFEGADSSIFHYLGLVTVGFFFVYALWHLNQRPKNT